MLMLPRQRTWHAVQGVRRACAAGDRASSSPGDQLKSGGSGLPARQLPGGLQPLAWMSSETHGRATTAIGGLASYHIQGRLRHPKTWSAPLGSRVEASRSSSKYGCPRASRALSRARGEYCSSFATCSDVQQNSRLVKITRAVARHHSTILQEISGLKSMRLEGLGEPQGVQGT